MLHNSPGWRRFAERASRGAWDHRQTTEARNMTIEYVCR